MESETNTWTQCNVGSQFGPHGGRQMRSPRYFVCGCDAGQCEAHGVRLSMPFGPQWEPGVPRKCHKHKKEARP